MPDTENNSPVVFDEQRAATYEQRFAKLAPLRDALHLLSSLIFSDLPSEANLLCVGAGTGAELLMLAARFPRWRFTAVEPAAPMLAICRQRAVEAGISDRCSYHEGYLDSLSASETFDAATSLLVSHFITAPSERVRFFAEIACRLRAGGILVTADLSTGVSERHYPGLLETQRRMLYFTGMPGEEADAMCASYGRDVAVLPPTEIEALIAAGGFDPPVRFFQSLLIHAWSARRVA